MEEYYTMYSLCKNVFMTNIIDIINTESEVIDEQKQREEAYREKVVKTFFEYGKLKAIPSQRKKERICLEVIADDFELGKAYEEAKVNQIIEKYYEDYCTLRRDMISEHIMKWEGAMYTRIK